MLINLYRIIKTGLKGFWRNRWVSQATVACMIITLFVVVSLFVVNALTDQLLTKLEQKIDITVYFKKDTPEKEAQKIKENVASLPEVKSTQYLSRNKALEKFKQRHQSDSLILESLKELEKNPLTASLNVQAKDSSEFKTIVDFIKRNYESLIDEVNYQESENMIARVNKFSSNIEKAGLILSIGLIIVVILVTYNTIRLSIYSLRDRITIMRLVGAPNWFIRGPFLIQGLIYGITATIFSTLILTGAAWLWGPQASSYLLGFNVQQYINSRLASFILLQLILGSTLGVSSSWVAVRKYLKI